MPAGRTARGPRRPSRGAGAVLGALLLGLGVWSVAALGPPAPRPADAPATEFSAARAFEQVRKTAAEVHVPGSEASARVVDDLVATLAALGLDTRVQSAVGTGHVTDGEAEMARVRTVVGVLPGSDSTGRLFLLAHHDSAATGVGATGAAGVAALLESVRALTAGPPLRNDVVVVLTDADEACRCGVEAFAASHPLAQEGGVVLAVDPRGGAGPAVLLGTSPRDADLAVLAEVAPSLVVSSGSMELHRALDDDRGVDVLLGDGRFTGLGAASLDGSTGTHTPQDVPDRFDRATLQALGDGTLAMARALGDRDLRELAAPAASDGDPTVLPVLGEPVSWSGSLDRPLAAAALLGVGGLVWFVGRQGLSWGRRTAATAWAAVPLVLGPLAVSALWSLLVAVRPGYAELIDPWRPGWYRLAAVALVLAVVLAWYALLRDRFGDTVLAVGGLVWPALGAGVLAVVAPGAAHLAALPALAGAAAVAICCMTTEAGVRIAAVLFAGGVSVVVLAPAVALSFPVVGLASAAVPALAVTLLALALLPALELLFPDDDGGPRSRAAAVPLAAAALAGVCVLAGLQVDRFGPASPVPSHLAYALDGDRQQAWWVSTEALPGDWTGGHLSARGDLPVDFPSLGDGEVAFGTAEPAALPRARVETLADAVVGGRREITVRVTPQRPGVRLVVLDLDTGGGTVARARVAGRGVPEEALGGSSLEITFHAPPADGLEASFSVEGGGPVSLRVVDGSTGLAGLPGLQPRPDGVGAAGTPGSDLVLVSGTTSLG
ncbi:M28 family peptidase [Candidatus Blastococcus massiliensis]|uniref:M28 family peptidase n=1 Tax=Candidatus Blastococcus massiliensis TaxID=1470358 RepID=UPI00058E45E6|nr:M28 family peptidase [Candidatus Blastococcus massiliensis]